MPEHLKQASYALWPTMVLFVLPLLLARGGGWLYTSLWKVGLPYTNEAKKRHALPDKNSDSCHLNHESSSTPLHHLRKIPSRNPETRSKQWSGDELTPSFSAKQQSCHLTSHLGAISCIGVGHYPQITSKI